MALQKSRAIALKFRKFMASARRKMPERQIKLRTLLNTGGNIPGATWSAERSQVGAPKRTA
jgi:hypothetical protein